MQMGLIPLSNFGCGYYRLFIPFHKMEKVYSNYHSQAMFTQLGNGINVDEYPILHKFIEDKDVIVIQRRYGEAWLDFAKMCKEQGKKVVYEIDDCFEGIPLENLKLNAIHMTKPETRNSVIAMLRIADAVTVSTPELKEWVCKYVEEEKVYHLKNTLDFSICPEPHYGIQMDNDPIVVGFAGSESHKTDLRELQGALEIINTRMNSANASKVVFGFFGFMLKEFWNMHPNVKFKLGVPFLEYPHMLSKLRFSIGLAPLKQCLFNQCKSELRFLEHAACGVPIVATDIAPFRRCVNDQNGILVKNNHRQWVRAIHSLIFDSLVRHDMGVNSYNYVKEYYNIDTYVEEWNKVYSKFT